MPAGLPALRYDYVRSACGRAPRFLGAPDRVHDEPSGVMQRLDTAIRVAQQERHYPQTSGKGLIESTLLIGGENEIARKGPAGERCRFTNQLSRVVGPPQP